MKKPKLTLPDGADRGTADYIISSFEELFGRPLDFEIKTDSSLLGGFVAEIDGCVSIPRYRQSSRISGGFS